MPIVPIASVARAAAASGTVATVLRVQRAQHGVISDAQAVAAGLGPHQIRYAVRTGRWQRIHPGVSVLASAPLTPIAQAHAALLWSGESGTVAACSAGVLWGLDTEHGPVEMAVGPNVKLRSSGLRLTRTTEPTALMPCIRSGLRVCGVEASLVGVAACRGDAAFEQAFEQARRRRLTTTASMAAYLARFGGRGRRGTGVARAVLTAIGGEPPSDSALEVHASRLVRANRWLPRPVRQYPLSWNGVTYRFDLGWGAQRVVLETNGRAWHDDPTDFEFDQQKWSVPALHGHTLVLATWTKVVERPEQLLDELAAALRVRRHRRSSAGN